jgi:membrane associated rhomboid family serine protease
MRGTPLYNRIVSTGGPDLFVICKSCGSEVSPYITECPYCGNRLRKRAPKLDRQGRVAERTSRRPPSPSLGRLRRNEIPGIRGDSHPYATGVLVIVSLAGCLIWRADIVALVKLALLADFSRHWWRAFTAPFTYINTGYAFVALTITALYGTLLERRHGPVPVIALFLIGAAGGTAIAAQVSPNDLITGGNGGALALLIAWAMPDLLSLRARREIDGDLLGTAVLAGVIALMPLVVPEASWICDAVGAGAGLVIGYPLARIHPS